MTITLFEVEKIARLASFQLTEKEKECYTGQLSSIVEYFDKLNELDTSQVEPMMHSTLGEDVSLTYRDDVVIPSLSQKEALANAPQSGEGHFKVPKVL